MTEQGAPTASTAVVVPDGEPVTAVTSTRLADGRELLYFDDGARPVPRAAQDTRDLPGRAPAGELRYDALTGEWVAVAAHRQTRTYLPPADAVPAVPEHARATPSEIPARGLRRRRVREPVSLARPGPAAVPEHPEWGRAYPAGGRCEVVSFTSEHTGSFAGLGLRRVRTVIDAWAHRTAALSALPGIAQVFRSRTAAAQIGVTLHHPHGQIYAYPYVHAARGRDGRGRAAALRRPGRAGDADRIGCCGQKRSDGSRMVLEGEHFSAYVPFAARWPLEVHLRPAPAGPGPGRPRPAPSGTNWRSCTRSCWAASTPSTTARLPTSPRGTRRPWIRRCAGRGHLHLQLTSPRRAADKLKYLAGSEAAMGAFINDTLPE